MCLNKIMNTIMNTRKTDAINTTRTNRGNGNTWDTRTSKKLIKDNETRKVKVKRRYMRQVKSKLRL